MDIQRHEHVVPLFSGLGTAAGVLREIRNAKQLGSTLEEIPTSTIMKGGLLGAGVGLAADLALLGMTARRGQERKRSGPSGGHYRGGNRPNQTTHSMRRSGKSGGSLPVRVD